MRCLAGIIVGTLVFIPVFAFADSNTDLLNGINQYRTAHDLSIIKENQATCTFATIRAIQIMSDFSHTQFYILVHQSWVPGGMWHENLAKDFVNENDVLLAWEHSPTHNANLLSSMTNGCVRHIGNYWTFEGFYA